MNKKIVNILGLVIFALAIAVFVAPVGCGIHASLKEAGTSISELEWSGYTVIFGNKANSYISSASSANIAAFTLLVIGVVFQTIATILLFPNPNGSKKFSGFLFFLGGIMEMIFAIIFLCAISTTGLRDTLGSLYNLKLGAGTIISGAAGLVAAALSLGAAVLSYSKK